MDISADYTCSECGRRFASEKGLADHYKNVHSEKAGSVITEDVD